MTRRAGRSLLQLPGPTNVPDAVLRALAEPTLDHRGVVFEGIARSVIADVGEVFGTTSPVAIFPASGTGGWEAALVNTLSPGDRVLTCETGFFAAAWTRVAKALGLIVDVIQTDWRRPVDPAAIADALRADIARSIRAVLIVHNETSTGTTSDVAAIRAAMDGARHPALLLVDTVSSLGAMPVEHDAWRVDVTVSASQKGLMLPPGLALLAISQTARTAKLSATLPRSYWDWDPMLAAAGTGAFPYTPASNMIVGLRTSLDLLAAEGMGNVFARHRRHGAMARAAVEHWGLTLLCADPAARSEAVTAVLLPEGIADTAVRRGLLDNFGVTIGGGLGLLKDRCLRIGHLGDVDDLMIISTLAALELELPRHGVDLAPGGVQAAMAVVAAHGMVTAAS
jgi:alanine-glyoxylate transaminase/serine-glyoxylate transaminase/serine-pyruvate transaminase